MSHRWAVLGWGGKSILGTLTSFGVGFFVVVFFFSPSSSAWLLGKGGQHMDCMVKQNCWRAGHRICLLLLLLMSLFNYLCSKWIKRSLVQGRGEVQPSQCEQQSAVYEKEK